MVVQEVKRSVGYLVPGVVAADDKVLQRRDVLEADRVDVRVEASESPHQRDPQDVTQLYYRPSW